VLLSLQYSSHIFFTLTKWSQRVSWKRGGKIVRSTSLFITNDREIIVREVGLQITGIISGSPELILHQETQAMHFYASKTERILFQPLLQ
jgi:hypothetical protein